MSLKNGNNGVFYTPPDIAMALVAHAIEHYQGKMPPRVLEPSCGDGSIVSAIASQLPVARLHINDIDANALAKAKLVAPWATATCVDILKAVAWHRGFDLIICNPPWISSRGRHKAEGPTHYEHVAAYERLLSGASGSLLCCLLPSSVAFGSKADPWRRYLAEQGLEMVSAKSMGIFRVPCASIALRRV